MSKVIDPIALGLEVVRLSGFEAHCRCPFHDDTTQSASFNVERGAFFCFACKESLSSREVAKRLGTFIRFIDMDDIDIPVTATDRPDWRWVLSAKAAYGNSYLASRGVTDDQIAAYDIREYDDGVLFPVKDRKGTIIGAQGRLYKGRYTFFGDHLPLWPMKDLGESSTIILVEGVFGALRARRYGKKAYAIMGAGMVKHTLPYIAGFKRKICVFDNDKAGHAAAIQILKAGIGAEAHYPGTEADEETHTFWDNVETMKLTMSFYSFL